MVSGTTHTGWKQLRCVIGKNDIATPKVICVMKWSINFGAERMGKRTFGYLLHRYLAMTPGQRKTFRPPLLSLCCGVASAAAVVCHRRLPLLGSVHVCHEARSSSSSRRRLRKRIRSSSFAEVVGVSRELDFFAHNICNWGWTARWR